MPLSAPVFRLKRQARLLSRRDNIPLHTALDRIARAEGYRSWSHLSARASSDDSNPSWTSAASDLLNRLNPGDMALLGARPGQGKTLLGLNLLTHAVRDRRVARFFTLEFTSPQTRDHLNRIDGDVADRVRIDSSDRISADHVRTVMQDDPAGSVAVVDYLQLLDRRRETPPLDAQLSSLKAFAAQTGVILVLLSQIDRHFDGCDGAMPGPADIRRADPLDIAQFTKTCFLHGGRVHLPTAA